MAGTGWRKNRPQKHPHKTAGLSNIPFRRQKEPQRKYMPPSFLSEISLNFKHTLEVCLTEVLLEKINNLL